MTTRSWVVVAAVSTAVLAVQLVGTHATAWHFFELAVDLLRGSEPAGARDGLALYADHPELQFGPLSILVAVPFVALGDAGEVLVMVVGSVVGLAVAWCVLDTIERLRPGAVTAGSPWVGITAASLIVATWGDVVVRTAHIDDAIAVAAVAVALRSITLDRGAPTMVALAVAAAAKPWAVVFAPLAAVPGPPGRRRWARPVIAAGAAVATWAPFVLAEPDTLDTSDFGITNDPTSSLRALGIDAATTPGWVRPAQLVGGLVLVGIVVGARRWPAAVLAGISWRLLLDPGVHRYYTVGWVLGALMVELRARPGRIPWCTAVGAAVLEYTAVPDVPVGIGQGVRLAVLTASFAAVAVVARRVPAPDRCERTAVDTPMTSP